MDRREKTDRRDREKDRKRSKRSRSRKRDKRDKERDKRDKDRKERKPEVFRDGEIKIKEEPIDGEFDFYSDQHIISCVIVCKNYYSEWMQIILSIN